MKYHDITTEDMLNGDGLRTVLWVSGCLHHCKECQNPITWDCNIGLDFTKETLKEIEEKVSKDYIAGITFSGGDPLHPNNIETIYKIAIWFKERFSNKTIWLYTGSKWEEIYSMPLMKLIDVVVDGEFIKELKDTKLRWKGSSNQRVINVKKTLEQSDISIPVIHCPIF